MNSKRLTSLGAALIATVAIEACAKDVAGLSSKPAENVAIIETGEASHRFNIELADSDEERRVGLMYRTEMADDAGMLFDFGEVQPVSMWMKNTLISLDMAFIDENGVIIRIAPETTPRSLESIKSGGAILGVLEVNGGTFDRLGVEKGDVVRHPMFERAD